MDRRIYMQSPAKVYAAASGGILKLDRRRSELRFWLRSERCVCIQSPTHIYIRRNPTDASNRIGITSNYDFIQKLTRELIRYYAVLNYITNRYITLYHFTILYYIALW